jgi:predicted Zn-dependent protease
MKVRSPFFAACCIAATALVLSLGACDRSESRAREGFAEYQAAAAAGDMIAARKALLKVVEAQDDNPTYWEELGKVQVELQSFSNAYYAYTRAYELDRTNAEILANLTQIALLSGNIETSEDYARKLELVAPDQPVIKLAYGYAAVKRQDFDEADRQANALLQVLPYETGAKLLKARILVARGKPDEAEALLRDQLRMRPDDFAVLKGLMALSERKGDWRGVASAATNAANLRPKDTSVRLKAVDAALRYNDYDQARRTAEPLLAPDAPGNVVGDVLSIWIQRWNSPDATEEAHRLSQSAGPEQKLAYATYFNEIGKPQYAMELLGSQPMLPITIANSGTNAIIAESLGQTGHAAKAKQLFDMILKREPDHVYALRARINLEIRAGMGKAAIGDAQRLVSVVPKSARDRLLLAKAYAAAGDVRQLDRTLWDAFHEIRGDRSIYEALRVHRAKTDGPDAVQSIDSEYRNQLDAELIQEFI